MGMDNLVYKLLTFAQTSKTDFSLFCFSDFIILPGYIDFAAGDVVSLVVSLSVVSFLYRILSVALLI